jgi:integrase
MLLSSSLGVIIRGKVTLINQNGMWHAELTIPKDVRQILGKRKFRKSMRTSDKSEAARKSQFVIARWKEHIAVARGKGGDVSFYREMYDNTSDEGKDVLEEMFAELVVDDYGKAHASQLSPSQLKNSQEAFQLMTGKETRTDIYIDEWLLGWDVKLQTRNQGRRYVEAMALKFPVVSMLTRKVVKAWYKELQEEKGITVKTFNGRLSPCKGYWSYLQDKGVVSEALNPFDGLGLRDKKRDIVRQPFTVLEIRKLFAHLKAESNQDPQLFQLFRLAIYTGARIEELCSIKTDEVGDGYLEISNSKTVAGVRQVPIHPEIIDAVAAMKMASEDGYLLSGLNGKGNQYGKRSAAIGKRFGRAKTKLGFGRDKVFHSIRKTVATQLEGAGVPENITADILGHEKQTITYGIYSGGTSLEQKTQAILQLSYR